MSGGNTGLTDVSDGRPRWESLLTMAWAIDRIGQRSRSSQSSSNQKMHSGRSRSYGKVRSSWRSSLRVGKQLGKQLG